MKTPGRWVREAEGWRRVFRVIAVLPISVPVTIILAALYIPLLLLAVIGTCAGILAGKLYGLGESGWW